MIYEIRGHHVTLSRDAFVFNFCESLFGMATKHRAIAKMNISRHGALLTHRSSNAAANGHPSRLREAVEKPNSAAESDSSIEIIEGNLFAEKGAKESVKKSKSYASRGYALYLNLKSFLRLESTHSLCNSASAKSRSLLRGQSRMTRRYPGMI